MSMTRTYSNESADPKLWTDAVSYRRQFPTSLRALALQVRRALARRVRGLLEREQGIGQEEESDMKNILSPLSKRIKAQKHRSLPIVLLDSWSSLNDNIVRMCILDHLKKRLQWYSEQSSCANIRATLDMDVSEAGHRNKRNFTMDLFSSFREEFKNCGPEVSEFLIDFDHGFMRSLPGSWTSGGESVPAAFKMAAQLLHIEKITRHSCACACILSETLKEPLLDELPFDSVWQLPLIYESVHQVVETSGQKDAAESFLDDIAGLAEYTLRINFPAFVLGLNDYVAFLQGAIATGHAIQTKVLAFCATAFLALLHFLTTRYLMGTSV